MGRYAARSRCSKAIFQKALKLWQTRKILYGRPLIKKYEYGFTTDVETEIIPTGLNEDVIRLISHKKQEPEWLLEFRLRAFHYWQTLAQPEWGHVNLPAIDYQANIFIMPTP